MTCEYCDGRGMTGHTFSGGEVDEITCHACDGTGVERAPIDTTMTALHDELEIEWRKHVAHATKTGRIALSFKEWQDAPYEMIEDVEAVDDTDELIISLHARIAELEAQNAKLVAALEGVSE